MLRPLLLVGAACLSMSLAAVAEDVPPGEKVICKNADVTGSRVRKTRICKTESQWRAAAKEAKDFMNDVDRRGSSQGRKLPAEGG